MGGAGGREGGGGGLRRAILRQIRAAVRLNLLHAETFSLSCRTSGLCFIQPEGAVDAGLRTDACSRGSTPDWDWQRGCVVGEKVTQDLSTNLNFTLQNGLFGQYCLIKSVARARRERRYLVS